ncbi:MAG: extracellular solute-binding protein [Hyphomicrobiales bacterium]
MMRGVLTGIALCATAALAMAEPKHGLSTFGELKYPSDFAHFDYVNPDAPKGGRIVTIGTAAINTFDSLNGYILKGDPAHGLDLLFDSLMVRANDEPDAMYGLLAKTADVAADRRSVTFALREEARFADGTPVAADDVCDSFRLLSTVGHERIRLQLRDVERCDIIDPHQVRYTFKGENTRDLPLVVAEQPVFSKAYYAKIDFTQSTLEPPLGSGPYKVGSLKPGQFISYTRRPDYWAKDLPANKGRYNFDEVRYEYFRDRTAELEALKAGVLDVREEFTSRDWATAYEIQSVKDGRLKRLEIPDARPAGAQGYFLNLRRSKFHDIRTRQALDLAFDFEWENKNLFFGLYKRTVSFFEPLACKAEGPPSPEELALLEPYRSELRPEVFGEPYVPPVSDGSGQDRKLLKRASELLDAAGWKREGTFRVNDKGERLAIEFLNESVGMERVTMPYVRNLKLLGIDATIRTVDEAQYQDRLKNYDFDVDVSRFSSNPTPGTELRIFFGSAAAKAPGNYNLAGLQLPVVDGLIDKVAAAKSRPELTFACRALDRVLRAEHFWVPHFNKSNHLIVHWDAFGMPQSPPVYDPGITDTWWYDSEKASKLRRGN